MEQSPGLTFHEALAQLMEHPDDEESFMAINLQAYDMTLQIYRTAYEGQFLLLLMVGEGLLTFSTVTPNLGEVLADFSIKPDDALWDVY